MEQTVKKLQIKSSDFLVMNLQGCPDDPKTIMFIDRANISEPGYEITIVAPPKNHMESWDLATLKQYRNQLSDLIREREEAYYV